LFWPSKPLVRVFFFNLQPVPDELAWPVWDQPKKVGVMCPLDFEKICPGCSLISIKKLVERDPKITCEIIWDKILHNFDEKINDFCRRRAETKRDLKED